MKLTIIKQGPLRGDAAYTLCCDGERITTHVCSGDGFAHFDLYRHKETKEIIGDLSLDDFRNIPIEHVE